MNRSLSTTTQQQDDDLRTDGGHVTTENGELVEDCRYCGESVDIEDDASFKSVSDRFAHAKCMADHCYEDRESVATTEGTFKIKPVTVIEKEGQQEKIIESFWRAECPMCWRTHETDSQDEDVRQDLVEQVIDCCDPVEWLPPEDYIEDCDICGDDHRESHGCTVLSRRRPFPSPDSHEYQCTECDWSGSEAGDFDNHDGFCPECDSAAVRAIEVATDGGLETAETEWQRRVTTRQEIEELLTDLDVGLHNMWVDIRESHPDFTGYEAVTVDVTVSVTGGQARADGGVAVDPDAPFPDTIEGTLDELEEFKGTEPRELSAEAFDRRWDLRSHLLDLIREDLDESEVSEATHIWWNDEAEFHLYCGGHYRPIADEQWSGFTTHPEPGEVRRAAQERLEAGALCEKCHSEAIYRRRDELFAERGIGDQDGDDDE